MYIFFTIFGIVFTTLFATVTNYIYELFPENKITMFIAPINHGIWSKINLTIFPTIIWGFIELPVLGNHNALLISIILNIVTSSAIMYIIRYGAEELFNKKNNVINLISIFMATTIGYITSYLFLLISKTNYNVWANTGALFLLLIFYTLLIKWPPKTEFFSGK